MKKLLIFLTFACSIHSYENGIATVLRVSDGDTALLMQDDDTRIKCRLYGIDAPEKAQPYGMESKKFLSQMILGRVVKYEVLSKDMYGRSVCILIVNDTSGDLYVNEHMLNMGMAWAYVQYLKKDRNNLKKYLDLQTSAMRSKYGLWQDPNPQAPWEYRRNKKSKR